MTTATATPAAPAKARTARKSTKLQGLQVFMENRLAVFGVFLLLILLAFSFIGPMFYVTDQVHTDLSISALPPSSEHPLGTDMVGYDQLGRLTFTDQMAEGILHLLGYRDGDVEPSAPAEYGTYNLTGSGPVESWAAIAARVFDLANGNGEAVEPVSTAEYYAAAEGPIAPRPTHSDLDLSKIAAAGFAPRDWTEELAEYMAAL